MPPDPPPRRRISDRDRRTWPDGRLNDLKEDVEDVQAEQRALAALYRQLAPLPKLLEQYMKATDSRLDRMHTDIRELRQENRTQHKRVAYGLDPEDGKTPLPKPSVNLTWGAVAKVATILAAFFGPTAALAAALLSG